jgi:acid phosphatase type 7
MLLWAGMTAQVVKRPWFSRGKCWQVLLLALLLACVLAWIAGLEAKGQNKPDPVRPARPDGAPTFVLKQFAADQPIRLIAYGDMRFTDPSVTQGTNPKVRRWLAEKIGQEHPQVLLLTGDMPYIGDKESDWEEYRQETASWKVDGFPIFPTIGNHEMYYDRSKGIANYLANYPELQGHQYYSAVLGPVEVIALDMTSAGSPRSEQYRWFAAQLEHIPAPVEFLFILYHMPWVADTQSQLVASLPTKEGLALRTLLEAHLSQIRAKVVMFSGHIHNYERFERKGVEYVVTGGGGAVPYPLLVRGPDDLYRDPGFPVYHYLTLEVSGHELHAEMWKVIDPDAAELKVEEKDSFVIRANSGGA